MKEQVIREHYQYKKKLNVTLTKKAKKVKSLVNFEGIMKRLLSFKVDTKFEL